MKVIVFLSLVAFVLSCGPTADKHCVKCVNAQSVECIQCNDNLLVYNGYCTASCPLNWAPFSGSCWACNPVCQTTATQSSTCVVTSTVGNANTAYLPYAISTCCPANCAACQITKGVLQCTSCLAPFKSSSDLKTCVCPSGTVANSQNNECINCVSGCTTCSLSSTTVGGTKCSACNGLTYVLTTTVSSAGATSVTCNLRIIYVPPIPAPKNLIEEKSHSRSKSKIQSKLSS